MKFVFENRKELDIGKDQWILYQLHGINLKYMFVDFRKVKRVSLRQELKHFLKSRFMHDFKAKDRDPLYLLDIANRFCDINPRIQYFSDIDIVDVKALQLQLENELPQTQIIHLFSICSVLFDFLCSGANTSKLPKPKTNLFRSFKLVNAKKYSKNTPYIPDVVVKGILDHIDELDKKYSRMFYIFTATGMRAKEVVFLEEDCLKKARYEGKTVLKYVPYKIIKARQQQGLDDEHIIYIDKDITQIIKEQIKESKGIREEYNSPYIFLYQTKGYKASMPDAGNYTAKINKLIKKHNICDESGELWHFTTRQCRKTLVVNMIENNATVSELAHQLGHLGYGTAMQYYTEVKIMKLAELNTEFYKKQFGLLLSGEKLAEFSAEERRLLYVDFRLSKRRVEFGYCMRKICEGACPSSSKTMHCVSCPNLCTGKQYLPYWSRLLTAQQGSVDILISVYESEKIIDYEDFAEYILEQRKLLAYENVVTAITESEG